MFNAPIFSASAANTIPLQVTAPPLLPVNSLSPSAATTSTNNGNTTSLLHSTASPNKDTSPAPLTTSSSILMHPLLRSTSTGLSAAAPVTSSPSTISLSLSPNSALSQNPITRQTTIARNSSIALVPDWRSIVTVEERLQQRARVKEAYTKQTHSYEELLTVVAAMEEELLFANAPSRLDYLKKWN